MYSFFPSFLPAVPPPDFSKKALFNLEKAPPPHTSLSAGLHLPVSGFSLGTLNSQTAAGLLQVHYVIQEVLGSFSL